MVGLDQIAWSRSRTRGACLRGRSDVAGGAVMVWTARGTICTLSCKWWTRPVARARPSASMLCIAAARLWI